MQVSAPPKLLENLAFLFPAFHVVLILSVALQFLLTKSLILIPVLAFIVYLLPIILWRLTNRFYPLTEGNFYIGRKESGTHSWLLAYKLQSLFISFSFFERLLIIVPGAYSAWLRLWGSQVGRKVTWTPRVDIIDRTSLVIKDFSFFGDKVYMSAHLIIRRKNRLLLIHRKIRVGEKCLIGFSCELGPGTNVKDNEMLAAGSRTYMNRITGGADELIG